MCVQALFGDLCCKVSQLTLTFGMRHESVAQIVDYYLLDFVFLVQVAVLHIENVFGFISVNCAVHYVKLYKYFFFQN